MVKGKNANKQSSSDANSEGSHPTVQRQLPRTAKQKHAAAEQERLRNVEKSTAALAKEAIPVGDTPTRLQNEAARGEITMREANIMRIAERDRIAKLQEWADKVGADEEEMREMVATVDPVKRPYQSVESPPQAPLDDDNNNQHGKQSQEEAEENNGGPSSEDDDDDDEGDDDTDDVDDDDDNNNDDDDDEDDDDNDDDDNSEDDDDKSNSDTVETPVVKSKKSKPLAIKPLAKKKPLKADK